MAALLDVGARQALECVEAQAGILHHDCRGGGGQWRGPGAGEGAGIKRKRRGVGGGGGGRAGAAAAAVGEWLLPIAAAATSAPNLLHVLPPQSAGGAGPAILLPGSLHAPAACSRSAARRHFSAAISSGSPCSSGRSTAAGCTANGSSLPAARMATTSSSFFLLPCVASKFGAVGGGGVAAGWTQGGRVASGQAGQQRQRRQHKLRFSNSSQVPLGLTVAKKMVAGVAAALELMAASVLDRTVLLGDAARLSRAGCGSARKANMQRSDF